MKLLKNTYVASSFTVQNVTLDVISTTSVGFQNKVIIQPFIIYSTILDYYYWCIHVYAAAYGCRQADFNCFTYSCLICNDINYYFVGNIFKESTTVIIAVQ